MWAISYGSHIPQGLCSVRVVFPIKPCSKAAIFCGSHAMGLSFPVSLARPEGKSLLATWLVSLWHLLLVLCLVDDSDDFLEGCLGLPPVGW